MASNAVRRPLPALISLVALLLLTGLVWWRVINRDDATTHGASRHCAPSSTSAPSSGTSTAATPGTAATTLPQPSAVTVLVLNSTNRQGIAGGARSGLQTAGFRSPQQAANFTGKTRITGVGEIRYGAGSKDAATLVRYYLPGMTLTQTTSAKPLVTVVLGPKYDGVLTKAQVAKALAAGGTTPSGAPSSHPAPRTC